MKRAARPLLLFGALVASVVLIGLEGCTRDCSPEGTSCDGSVLVGCISRGDVIAHHDRTEHDCAADGKECVEDDQGAECAVRDPACDSSSYCKEDHVITCADYAGYAVHDRACTPYACVQADGGDPVCASPDTECFDLPDGQYCLEYSMDAVECLQRAQVRRNSTCEDCYIGPDGKAASKETNAPCI